MSKNKRQLITVLVLIVLLAAVSVGYFFLSKNKPDTEEGVESITLSTPDNDDIQKLQYKMGNTDMSFTKKGDDWKYDEDDKFPVNTGYLTKMLGDMSGLTATKLVTKESTDLKQYGLDAPQLTVKIADASGAEKTFVVGNESTIASGCYAYLDDTKTIYIVSSELLDDFKYTKEQMMKTPDSPNIIASNVKSYQLLKGNKKIIDNKVKDGDSNATVVYSGLANIIFTGGVSYDDDASMIKKCGLNKPQYTAKIKYYETVPSETAGSETDTGEKRINHTLILYIGDKSNDGSYYVKVDGTEGIYLMSDAAVQSLIEIKDKAK